jgi:hypothetical protein
MLQIEAKTRINTTDLPITRDIIERSAVVTCVTTCSVFSAISILNFKDCYKLKSHTTLFDHLRKQNLLSLELSLV